MPAVILLEALVVLAVVAWAVWMLVGARRHDRLQEADARLDRVAAMLSDLTDDEFDTGLGQVGPGHPAPGLPAAGRGQSSEPKTAR